MMKLRLVADDLTSALDSAAQFAGPGRAIPVYPNRRLPETLPPECAVDGASREESLPAAEAMAARLAPVLAPGPGVTAFRKLDSLLRGHPGPELAATLRAVPVRHCLIAPAFPFQGRVTRGGLQFALAGGVWRREGASLREELEARGLAVRLMRPGDPAPEGVGLWDAETDDDLRRIAHAGSELPGSVLWCGSAGLAAALSGSAAPAVPAARIGRPILGVFGSDHPVTAAQLGDCGDGMRVRALGDPDLLRVPARLERDGVCLVSFGLAPGLARPEASRLIARGIDALVRRVPRPRSLLVAGGETLRAVCLALGAGHLSVQGQVVPGVPVSVMVGGRWDGVQVISKSGAFGDDGLLARMVLGADAGQNGSTPARGSPSLSA